MEQIPIFRLDGGDLQHIVQNIYKLTVNKLSPFQGMPSGGGEPAPEALKLAQDKEFKAMAAVLAQPALKLTLRRGGATLPLEASSLYIGSGAQGGKAVYLQEEGGLLSATYFHSLQQYAGFFAEENAAPVSLKPANTIKQELSLEDLFFIFNLTDCYRRGYLHKMLQDSYEPVDAVYEDECVAVLEKELQSGDIRWLIPSFLRLVPGMESITLNFSAEQVEKAEAMDLISRGANQENNRPIYYLGGTGKYLGLEFSLFWHNSAGFEAVALNRNSGETESLGKFYFAPTVEANHLFTITGSGASLTVHHQALTREETSEALLKILEGKSAKDAAPEKKFCGNCGVQITAEAAFCGNCGAKI
jgi:hypothetical protein